jgi:molybdopterin-guanine dinucleotide biosynthesis protein A
MFLPDEKQSFLKGLILAGGKSSRMGTDKGLINWQGKPHRYYLADLLSTFCEGVYISCKNEQRVLGSGYQYIEDIKAEVGPFGGLYSAFTYDPNAAWLIVACDFPLLDSQTIRYLIDHRNPDILATAYENPLDLLPEPLLAIWEPRAFPILKIALQEQKTSLRRILINNSTELIAAENPALLLNVNTKEDRGLVR